MVGMTETLALPPEIAALTRLEELGLCGLGLTKVSDALISLPRLERLNLDYNRLTTLPERIGEHDLWLWRHHPDIAED